MGGSVSTLAPIFATAFAKQDTRATFPAGSAAAVGGGISMGFTEAAHDDGVLSGRGSPQKRGIVLVVMRAVGRMGLALPSLIPGFRTATTIARIRNRSMETRVLRAALQVLVGGALVFAAGVLIGGG